VEVVGAKKAALCRRKRRRQKRPRKRRKRSLQNL
jgi:hypothetical protein